MIFKDPHNSNFDKIEKNMPFFKGLENCKISKSKKKHHKQAAC